MELPALIDHLAKHAPAFSARLQSANLTPEAIRSVEDLEQLPVIRKDDLHSLQASDPPFGGYLTVAPGDLKRIFQSPGPIYDPEPRRPDYWRWAPALQAAGFAAGQVVLNAFGYHLTPAGAMFEEGLWTLGCAVIPGGIGNQEQQIQTLEVTRATGYVGLPSYLKALLDQADASSRSLFLERAFFTAEPLPPSLRALFHEQGLTVRQGYGTAECGNLGYECEQEAGWHVPEEIELAICDINDGRFLPLGETGEIVVTLYNPEYALVRFGTGDLSALTADPCACGRPGMRLLGWQGRAGDAVKVRGMFLHPHQLQKVMSGFEAVQRWQARITREEHKDFLSLRVVAAEGAPAELVDEITLAVRSALKFKAEVEFIPAGELPDDAPPVDDQRQWD